LCNFNGLQDRVAIPKANEALPPQEAAAGPTEYTRKQVQAEEETFTQKQTAEPHTNATDCMSEITPAEDLLKANKRNAENVQGAAKKRKGTVAEIYGTSVTMKRMVYGRLILKLILNVLGWLEID
jgi:hypothetical protein